VTAAFVPAPRFVGFAHSAPRELRDVDDLYDLRAGHRARPVDVYTGATPPRGLPSREPAPGRTALLARELTSRATLLALG
jgi:hypothetical protein